jgi:hypothetical protein
MSILTSSIDPLISLIDDTDSSSSPPLAPSSISNVDSSVSSCSFCLEPLGQFELETTITNSSNSSISSNQSTNFDQFHYPLSNLSQSQSESCELIKSFLATRSTPIYNSQSNAPTITALWACGHCFHTKW